jgi:hypothetical protein
MYCLAAVRPCSAASKVRAHDAAPACNVSSTLKSPCVQSMFVSMHSVGRSHWASRPMRSVNRSLTHGCCSLEAPRSYHAASLIPRPTIFQLATHSSRSWVRNKIVLVEGCRYFGPFPALVWFRRYRSGTPQCCAASFQVFNLWQLFASITDLSFNAPSYQLPLAGCHYLAT